MRGFTIASGRLAWVLLAASMWLIAAQNPPRQTEGAPAEQAQPEPAKPPALQAVKPLALAVDPKTFNLGPEDVVLIQVWREPQLSGTFVIRPDGIITMPLIRDVKAAGMTPEQLGNHITDLLSKYLNSPQVIVAVQQVRSKRYYITGEIQKPGVYPLAVPITVFEAITTAGGFREFANKKKITIIRGSKRIRFNYNDIVKGKNLAQNIYLENGDQIVVP